MTDAIRVRDLRVETHIGLSDEERAHPQWLLVSLEVVADLRSAGESDDLSHSVNYHTLVTDVTQLVRSTRVKLLERLAQSVAELVLARPGVVRVSVDIAKEAPPIEEDVGRLSVSIERP